MKSRWVICLALVVGVAGACSLNPQPLPPDNPDGSLEAGNVPNDATTTFGDSSTPGSDSGAGEDASDAASTDGAPSADASDASDAADATNATDADVADARDD